MSVRTEISQGANAGFRAPQGEGFVGNPRHTFDQGFADGHARAKQVAQLRSNGRNGAGFAPRRVPVVDAEPRQYNPTHDPIGLPTKRALGMAEEVAASRTAWIDSAPSHDRPGLDTQTTRNQQPRPAIADPMGEAIKRRQETGTTQTLQSGSSRDQRPYAVNPTDIPSSADVSAPMRVLTEVFDQVQQRLLQDKLLRDAEERARKQKEGLRSNLASMVAHGYLDVQEMAEELGESAVDSELSVLIWSMTNDGKEPVRVVHSKSAPLPVGMRGVEDIGVTDEVTVQSPFDPGTIKKAYTAQGKEVLTMGVWGEYRTKATEGPVVLEIGNENLATITVGDDNIPTVTLHDKPQQLAESYR